MTFAELREANVKRSDEAFNIPVNLWSATDWACAVAGETGELCNLIKKSRRGEDIDSDEIADEAADVLIYLDLLAARLGIDLEEAVERKFNRTSMKMGSSIRL